MIPLKDAVKIAKQFITEVYAHAGEELQEVGLEEVDRTEDGREWLITIGFTSDKPGARKLNLEHSLGRFVGGLSTLTREYKVVHIDAETGEPRTIKIREV